MHAEIGDHPFDAAHADGEIGLAEFLGDDLGRDIGIQKAMAQDLADDFVGAAVVGFGAGFFGFQSGEAALVEEIEQLVITLARIVIFLSDSGDMILHALAFNEHEEAASQFVGSGDGQGTGWAGELMRGGIELEGRIHGRKN